MSHKPVITVENLGKRYRLGQVNPLTRTFREAILGLPSVLLRKSKHLIDGTKRKSQNIPHQDPETPPGTFWALRDVSFQIHEGDVVGIIGRNGAGKSTLLKILSRITTPTRGTAILNGRLSSLLEVGTGFHPELTGRENIFLNGAILGMRRTEIKSKFDEIVAFSEVEKFLDTPVKFYSSGMYVRLAFAVAAHLEPEILVVDEVLAVGDAQFQQKCLGKMQNVAGEGRTVLFVSHNMQAVRRLCTSGILLHEGKLVKTGPVSDIVDLYMSHLNEQRDSLSITPEMHWKFPPDLEIQEIKLFNQKGERCFSVMVHETFTLEMKCHIRNPMHSYRIGIQFRTPDGIRVGTLISTQEGIAHLRGNAGSIVQIQVKIQNPLLPGHYRMDLHVKDASGEWIDQIEGLPFDVSAISVDGRADFGSGIVYFPAEWRVPSASA